MLFLSLSSPSHPRSKPEMYPQTGRKDSSISAGPCQRAQLQHGAAARSRLQHPEEPAQQHPASTRAEARLQAFPKSLLLPPPPASECLHPRELPLRAAGSSPRTSPQHSDDGASQTSAAEVRGGSRVKGKRKEEGDYPNSYKLHLLITHFQRVDNSRNNPSHLSTPPGCLQSQVFWKKGL